MSLQASPIYFWEADVEIETTDLAFSPQTATEGRGALAKQLFTADWLHDGVVYFSPSKRLGGWLKAQLPLARSTYANQMANAGVKQWQEIEGIGKKTAERVVKELSGER